MGIPDDKRVEWQYEHFQAVSAANDRLLFLFAFFFVCSLAVWRSTSDQVKLPFIDVLVGREVLLGTLLLGAVAAIVAFFGNYDKGEAAISELAKRLDCNYDDLEFIDTHPTLIDFIQYRRAESAAKRRLPGRLGAALLYPLVLVGTLAFLSAVAAHELLMAHMSLMDVTPFVLAAPLFWVAWDRACEYIRRRWSTFRTAEKARPR